ncbi:Cullin-domain-containing protein [Annulohypoxylon maeteangense]|uniref:Cullin-domain-containing protein n=1 Tax=Annulohypoxylon maeteangense TaxID=1927788 RepID=UPI002008A8B0|nr:Cullin-domain-containing protein [Annulohypoxylon maeteangense]KAI0887498.1 Cullin-domain-containing protein [Annulohypoxylon maeteangense]
MHSPGSSPLDGPSSSRPTPSKRKPVSSAGNHSRQNSTNLPSGPDPKRTKLNNSFDPGTSASRMSKVVLGKRPEIVDLTKPPTFQPHKGAKKLVIKNLRTTPRGTDLEEYYRVTKQGLLDALQAIFEQKQPRQPLERLYRGVEDLCRHGASKELYDVLKERCDAYLNNDLHKSIMAEAGSSNLDILRSTHKRWQIWIAQSTTIRSVFSYLDRSFLLRSKDFPQINDLAISLFRRVMFVKSPSGVNPGAKSLIGMCDLVEYDRRGDSRFDSTLLHDSIAMLNVLNIYGKSFEPHFLKTSEVYFREFAEVQSCGSLKTYIYSCEKLLEGEDYRCNRYNFDSTTKRQLMESAHAILIQNYSEKLLDGGSIGKLLDENAMESMKALYDLLRLSGIQKKLRQPWEEYIKDAGSVIVNDTSRGDEMVVRLLEFRRSLDLMIRDAFNRDEEFTYSMRQAFGSFINDRKVQSAWKTGTSKVGEMIAKYIDMLLRGGLKTLPKSLLSDTKDRVDAEQSGLASTGDEDAELDRQLDQALELFRFIEGKDVFEAFYKQDLARRLLMGRSASADAERSMLAKLKNECGSNFTHNLEQMFKDQQLARDEMASYKSWCEGNGHSKSKLDLNVNILSAAAWPTYPDTQLTLPDDVAAQIGHFEKYYVNKHTGRRLTWKHSLAHCLIKGRFNKGPKELLVSSYQAVVLTLFNHIESDPKGFLTYQHISDNTGLSGPDLSRTLQSLACGKTRVLSKHPKGRDVNTTDTFTVNKTFTDPKYRVKINQVQLKETKEENQDTHERIAQDRQFECQAAIVRIMKSRKTMTHANLVAEVINQTKSRGAIEPAEIKKNIEKLIEKDYLEREGGSYTYLA